MNNLYIPNIKNNPYPDIGFDILKLYKSSRGRDKKILLHDISEFISKPRGFNEENNEQAFLDDVDYFIEEAEFFRLDKLVALLKSLKKIESPITQAKVTAVLKKAEDNWDLTNNNVKSLKKLSQLTELPEGNKTPEQGAIWIGEIKNNNNNNNNNNKSNGGRRKTHKRHSKRRHTRRK